MSWESQGIALLSASLARPFVLVAAAWVILRVFRVRHPASRHAVWTAVLIGMLLLPFVSVTTPHWKLPVLPRKHEIAAHSVASEPAVIRAFTPLNSVTYEAQAKQSAHVFAWPSFETLIVWCYFAGFFVMVTYRVAGWALLWRVMSRSRPLRGRTLRESGDVLTPVAVGVLCPVVILPVGWRDWNTKTRHAVLAHEFAHLRRHDALISALAWWVKCVFWFHPLTWWVSRTVSDLAELACDAAALEKVGDPTGYSRMLLGFADTVNRAGGRVTLPGLAMAAGSGIDRRIDLVFEFSDGNMRKLSRPGVLLALLGLPMMCLAATVGLGENGDRSTLPFTVHMAVTTNAPAILAQSLPPAAGVTPIRQSMAPLTPRFEVASIKPTAPQANGQHGITMHGGPGTSDPTRIAWTNVSLTLILKLAYHAYFYQIIRPAWFDSQSYDINATLPPGTTKEQFNMMLVNLLQERFKVVLHREPREFQGFELVVGKNGSKLRKAAAADADDADSERSDTPVPPETDKNGFPKVDRQGVAIAMKMAPGARVPSVYLTAKAQPLDELVHMLGEQLGRPVVDKTGLTGKYDYTLEFPAQESLDGQDDSGPSILTGLQKQLGLKLEPQKVPLEMLIVDHADKAPTDN